MRVGALLMRLTLPFLLCSLPNVPVFARGDDDERGWSISETADGGLIRAITRGQIVRGHQFGFFVRRPDCGQLTLWVSLSSYKPVERAEGTIATFDLDAPNARRTVQLPLLIARPLPGGLMTLVAFTNRPLEVDLAQFFRTHQDVTLRIVAPEWLVEAFDMPKEVFDLSGYALAEEDALTRCRSRHLL